MIRTRFLCYTDFAETVWVSGSCFAFNLRYNLVTALIPPDRLSNDTDTELAQYCFKAESMNELKRCTDCGAEFAARGRRSHRCDTCQRIYERYAKAMHKQSAKMIAYLGEKKCAMCGETNFLVVDHIKPLAKGGTNDLHNLQILCGFCNDKKGTKESGRL